MSERELNRRAVENLIKCGAFDKFGARSQHLQVYEKVLDDISINRSKNVAGQMDLFSMGGEETETFKTVALPNIPEFDKKTLLTLERETAGLYLSGHPMEAYTDELKRRSIMQISQLTSDDAEGSPQFRDGQVVLIAGAVSEIKTKTTRSNQMMAYLTLEDISGTAEIIVFPKILADHRTLLREDALLVVRGRISIRDEGAPQILCDSVEELTINQEPVKPKESGEKLYLRFASQDDPKYTAMSDLLRAFPGERTVILYFADSGKRLKGNVEADARLHHRITVLMGEENAVLK